jgi:hypothetical protein
MLAAIFCVAGLPAWAVSGYVRVNQRVQKLTFTAALFDPHGKFVTGKQADMELALKPESFERFSKTGINGVMKLEAPPGTYRLRMVVQEAFRGTLSATTKNLQIP